MKTALALALCAVTVSGARQWIINHGQFNGDPSPREPSDQEETEFARRGPHVPAIASSPDTRIALETQGFNENARAPSTHTFRASLADEDNKDFVDSLLGSLDGSTQVISDGHLTDAVQSHDLKWAVISGTDGVIATGHNNELVQALLDASLDGDAIEDPTKPVDPWHEPGQEHALLDDSRRHVYRYGRKIFLDEAKKPAHRRSRKGKHVLLEDEQERNAHWYHRDLLVELRNAIDNIVDSDN
ncbi:hypothetical protein DYB32_010485 [Aphanomyces invadans]|uniref:RxLR effector protein n=2 Tax=Aphanomyces invadans TaxID=157072 RepID=A0A418AFT2_9STRA|nr:hypothetical protein DYB32_010485 [Aphanomyces invadans]